MRLFPVDPRDIGPWLRQSWEVRGALFPAYFVLRILEYLYFSLIRRGTFKFDDQKLSYFYHFYNLTFRTERCVEIPIALSLYRRELEILEVGNVLRHYFDMDHDVVDKYERTSGVVNEDIVDFDPGKSYDLVLSISTLEHVGWDEEKEPQKTAAAVAQMKGFLRGGGTLLATMPLGYNPHLDRFIREEALGFSRQLFLKRISRDNRWREASYDEVKGCDYGRPYPCANALCVGIFHKED